MTKYTIYKDRFEIYLPPYYAAYVARVGLSSNDVFDLYIADGVGGTIVAQFDTKECALDYIANHHDVFDDADTYLVCNGEILTGRLSFIEESDWEYDEDLEKWVFSSGSNIDPIAVMALTVND